MSDYQLYLITAPNCKSCPPYKSLLETWKIEFKVIDGSTLDGKKFCAAYKIQGVPNLVIMHKGKFIGSVPGFINDPIKLKLALQKIGRGYHE